jgi:hypothetical protein
MAPRTNWRCYLKLSLDSCPVALYPAAAGTSERVTFPVLNRSTVVPTCSRGGGALPCRDRWLPAGVVGQGSPPPFRIDLNKWLPKPLSAK